MKRIARRLAHALPLAVAVALAWAEGAPTSAHAALSAVDDAGRTVTLAGPAARVISLAPHTTELIYAAGGGARLVGAVSYSDYPPEANALPRVGSNSALDLERIVSLKPDLIVVWRHGNDARQLEKLRELGIALFVSEPHKVDDVATNLERLGTLLGESDVNIGTFHLGRRSAGGEAVLLLSVDEAVDADLIARVRELAGVKTVMGLSF